MLLQRSTVQFQTLDPLAQAQHWDFDAIVQGPRARFSMRDEFAQVIGTPDAQRLLSIAQKKPAHFSTLLEADNNTAGPWSYLDGLVSCQLVLQIDFVQPHVHKVFFTRVYCCVK